MPRIALMVNEMSEDGRLWRMSSQLWTRLLLANSNVVFADGEFIDFKPAKLISVKYDEIITGQVDRIFNPNLPGGLADIDNRETFRGVVFTVEGNDLRIRVRAYHRHDGKEFGHPGPMRLEAADAREWDAVYKMLQERKFAVLPKEESK